MSVEIFISSMHSDFSHIINRTLKLYETKLNILFIAE